MFPVQIAVPHWGDVQLARRPSPPDRQSAKLSTIQMAAALPKLRKRLLELKALNINSLDEETGGHILDSLSQKINTTLRDIYSPDTIEYDEYHIETFQPRFSIYYGGMDTSLRGNIDIVRDKVGAAISKLETIIELISESLGDSGEDAAYSRVIHAYERLELHREIARAASQLYRDGHYANAVEAAVKALNGLVRLRTGLEQDGTSLMERAFSPSNPTLKFNSLVDQSDRDEQKGFMQLFSGAVSGLRNPRAHGFIRDEPERALEFIAFVSLLAKLLDEAN